jgi:hypothetical protein
MTLEFSLRRRAARSRYMAIVWLLLATLILVVTYISLPLIASRTITTFGKLESQPSGVGAVAIQPTADNKAAPHIELYALGVVTLALLAISFACFLLGRTAFVEIELAARFAGLADAVCIAGDSFDNLEKAANLLAPGTKYLSVPEIFSIKDLGSVLEVLKQTRPK